MLGCSETPSESYASTRVLVKGADMADGQGKRASDSREGRMKGWIWAGTAKAVGFVRGR